MRSNKVYQERLEVAKEQLSNYVRTDRFIGIARLITAILSIVFLYRYFISLEIWNIYVFVGATMGFGILLRYHQRVRDKRKKWETVLEINETEISALNGNYSSIDGGNEFRNSNHLFSDDLHLFGDYSIFKHLNRTITDEGKKLLARRLLSQQFEDTIQHQEAIQELTSQHIDREEFRIYKNTVDISTDLTQAIKAWKNKDSSIPFTLRPIPLIILSLICLGTFVNFVIAPTSLHFYIFIGAFFINIFYFNYHKSRLDDVADEIDEIGPSLLTLSKIAEWVEERNFESLKLTQIKQALASEKDPVSQNLSSLSSLIQTIESRQNAVGSIIFNGLFLLHLHTFRRILKWKNKNIDKISEWIVASAEMDVYISLSNYAFNHPENSYPTLLAEPDLSFEELRHPLMIHENNVGNSFKLKSGDVAILTGSNMAGKSTFLRTIGTNIILAKVGVPIVGKNMKTYPFQLTTSMQVHDALSENTSYFLAEVLRLRKIMDFIKQSDHCLLLIDEILRGTNSVDKKTGTIDVLKKLSGMNCSTVLATHDIAVAKYFDSQPDFSNWFFMSKLKDRNLVFDYKLRKGISTNPNARILLQRHAVIEEE